MESRSAPRKAPGIEPCSMKPGVEAYPLSSTIGWSDYPRDRPKLLSEYGGNQNKNGKSTGCPAVVILSMYLQYWRSCDIGGYHSWKIVPIKISQNQSAPSGRSGNTPFHYEILTIRNHFESQHIDQEWDPASFVEADCPGSEE